MMRAAADLLRAAHLGPSLVVTTVTLGLAAGAGADAAGLLWIAVAVLAGQLSIGWSNDWIDGSRGLDHGREDKPVATGAVRLATVRLAALTALAVTVAASWRLGVAAGCVHLLAVALGWAYNARLKATSASILAYAAAFAALPVVVSLAVADALPRPWAPVAAACFGAGAHLSNALPDIAADRVVGVMGLPQRLGQRGSGLLAALLLAGGAGAALVAPFGTAQMPAAAVVALAVAIGLLLASLLAVWRGRAEDAYRGTILVGLLVVAGVVAAGGRLI